MCENRACVIDVANCSSTLVSGYCGAGRYAGGGGGWGGSGSGWSLCPANASYVCFDGLCARSPQECSAGLADCAEPNPHRCADGRCVADSSGCPLGSGCPAEYPRRCWDGSCIALNASCTAEVNCTRAGEVHCPDGKCYPAGQCPAYNGCPASHPILCPDGTCGAEEEDCMTHCLGGLYHCADGRCEANFTACGTTANAAKPGCLRFTQTTSGARMAIPNAAGDQTIGVAVAPAYAIMKPTNPVQTPPIRICSVADSFVRNYTALTDYMVAPLLQITTDPAITVPFPRQQAMTISLKPTVAIAIATATATARRNGISDYCLAVIDALTRNITCVSDARLTTDSTGAVLLQGSISSLTADQSVFTFIKRAQAGAHCAGTSPTTCSDGSCAAYVQQCLPPSTPGAGLALRPALAGILAAAALGAALLL
eukprot:GAFH01000747.1.p2 GENE.GAFH01000747.1~~GAFH01000747.1.p2  ORF type:complete len:426 (-),score=183.65 GAFH01000747.1:479-1756(-)